MKPLKMQPTFRVNVPVDAKEAITKIRAAIKTPELHPYAESAGPCVDFKVAPADQRFWSPHLSIQVSDTTAGAEIYGRFSPRPEVWTMFMGIYAIAASISFGAAIYGYCQWFMGNTPWALIGVPVGALVILFLHVASLVGQSLSSDQMEVLRERFDHAIELAFAEDSMSSNAVVPAP